MAPGEVFTTSVTSCKTVNPLNDDVPATVKFPESDQFVVGVSPEVPADPDVPLVPLEPALPDVPDDPLVPSPDVPEEPDVPLEPDVPFAPVIENETEYSLPGSQVPFP